MFGRGVAALVVVLLVPAACGRSGDDATSADVALGTEPSESPDPAQRLEILRPDGLGPVDLGDPEDEAMAAFVELFGPADAEELIDGERECVEGSRWPDCLEVVDTGRVVSWNDWGLDVLFSDWDEDDPLPVAHTFASWRSTPTTDQVLTTPEGLRAGMQVGDLTDHFTADDFGFAYNEGVLDGVWFDTDDGGYWGWLDWDPTTPGNEWPDLVRAVQTALNTHGAELVVDGVWGPRSQASWEQFLTDQGVAPIPSTMWLTPAIGEALGLPPDTFVIASLEPLPPAIEPPTPDLEGSPPTSAPPPPESSIVIEYLDLPGSPDVVFEGPEGVDATDSTYSRVCDGLPRDPGPDEVAWHFVLPASIEEERRGEEPRTVFRSLTLQFRVAGTSTLTSFGPPTAAHAYAYTRTDDTFVGGYGDILRRSDTTRETEAQFDLSSICRSPGRSVDTEPVETEPGDTEP